MSPYFIIYFKRREKITNNGVDTIIAKVPINQKLNKLFFYYNFFSFKKIIINKRLYNVNDNNLHLQLAYYFEISSFKLSPLARSPDSNNSLFIASLLLNLN